LNYDAGEEFAPEAASNDFPESQRGRKDIEVGRVQLRLQMAKLRAMSAHEVAGRVREHIARIGQRASRRQGVAEHPERLLTALVPGCLEEGTWKQALLARRRQRARRFFVAPEERAWLGRLIVSAYPEDWRRTCLEADRLRRHTVHFFGQTFELGARIDWHADPVSGRRWPNGWYSDIPVLGEEGSAGDVKYVWELNRHQFLVDLAQRHWVSGDPSDAATVVAIVRDWIEKNPYGCGVSWASPLEPAYRVLSWLWAYHLCLDAEALDEDTHALWLAGFHDHATFLSQHLELYSSPFNHLIGEATALYLVGLLFPEFERAAAWRERGREVLEGRLDDQFYRDGGSVEQATCYHHATLGFYVMAAVLGRTNGYDFSPAVWRAIERAVEFSMYVIQPDGCAPAIGDTDDAKPIPLGHGASWDFRVFQATGAVLFDRPDFKYVARGLPEEALWLLGRERCARYRGLEATVPSAQSKALYDSGYFVLRSDWSDTADYACVDCGPQAGGLRHDSVPSAAHGHADCLSLTLFLGGRPALVDAGFFTYNGDRAWERHFRETAAHNTARIDGRDQAAHLHKMAWAEVPRVRVEDWGADGSQAWVVGSHDGYARGPLGVTHRRAVWLRPGGYVIVYDEFLGRGEHDVELNFQLPPGPAATLSNGSLRTAEGLAFYWIGTQAIAADMCRGGAQPNEGWVAPGLGVRLPAPKLTLRSRLTQRHEGYITVIADARRVSHLTHARVAGTTGVDLGLVMGEWTDRIIATTTAPVTSGGFSTDASVAVWRLHRDEVVNAVHIGGSYSDPQPIASPRPEEAGVCV